MLQGTKAGKLRVEIEGGPSKVGGVAGSRVRRAKGDGRRVEFDERKVTRDGPLDPRARAWYNEKEGAGFRDGQRSRERREKREKEGERRKV